MVMSSLYYLMVQIDLKMIYQIFLIQTTLINLVLPRDSDTLDFRPRVIHLELEFGKSPFDYDSRDFSVTGSTSPLIPKILKVPY